MQVEIVTKYAGYVDRQEQELVRFRGLEQQEIPAAFPYAEIKSLGVEARQKLEKIRPTTLGQASRISGVSPSDISLVMVWMKRFRQRDEASKTDLEDGPGPEDGTDDSRGCSC